VEVSGQLHTPVAGTHSTEGWVGPQTGLDSTKKRKILPLTRTQTPIPQPSSPQPVAIPTVLSQVQIYFNTKQSKYKNLSCNLEYGYWQRCNEKLTTEPKTGIVLRPLLFIITGTEHKNN
jgi:hypothetical protein